MELVGPPIDISSTDSDSDFREIDNYRDESPVRDTASSINSRIFPSSDSTVHSNLSGPSPEKQIQRDEISSKLMKQLNTPQTVGPSTSKLNGNVHKGIGSRHGARQSHEVHSSYQSTKTTLSTSLQPSTSGMQSNILPENAGTNGFRKTLGKSYDPVTWSNTSTGKNSTNEIVVWDSGNDSTLYEKSGNKLLPPPSISGKHSSAIPLVSSSDYFHNPGLGEERSAGGDERFVFQAALRGLHQPKAEATLPEGLLSVSLLRHQKIALAWMLRKESSGLCLGGILADDQGLGKTVSMIALIHMQRILEAKPSSKRNGMPEALNLDDDDGGSSGCVALDENQVKDSDDIAIPPKETNTLKEFRSKRPTAGTLVVCPSSVLRQWARELDEKVTDEARLSVLIYHGGNRTKNPAVLAKYDVVLTTYSIVATEVPKQPLAEEDDNEQKDGEQCGLYSAFSVDKKRKKSSANKNLKKGKKEIDVSLDSSCGTLARVKWSRIVLDESQTIKNHKTQVAGACCNLRAKRRWCLSGTPIQNSIDELFSYFRFLRYDPYDKHKIYVSSIKALITRDPVKGYKKLQFVLRNIMLRRTKGTLIDGKPIIELPPRKVHLTKVEFSSEERTFYDKLEMESRKQFKAYADAGTVNQNYANLLMLILRLRQACDHPLLVKRVGSDPVGMISCEMAKMLPRELLVNLYRQLETSLAICLVCRDPPENAVVTMCGHVFCYQCVADHLTGEDNTCPAPRCKEKLGADVVYSRSTLRRCISNDADSDASVSYEGEKCSVLLDDYVSSKIKSALEIIKAHCLSKNQSSESYNSVRYDRDASSSGGLNLVTESREKAIVFSQWTSMLDLLEISLKNHRIKFRRLDGTMSLPARERAVKDFHTRPEVDVMLISLKAGNLGLNMVAASRVILLDLWWNPSTEDQAIDRAHRIGQTRPVTVSRLTIKHTVEDRIITLQEMKRKIIASAFGEDPSDGHSTRLTVEDLRFLFEGSRST